MKVEHEKNIAALNIHVDNPLVMKFKEQSAMLMTQFNSNEDQEVKLILSHLSLDDLKKLMETMATNNTEHRIRVFAKHIFADVMKQILSEKAAHAALEENMYVIADLVTTAGYMTQNNMDWKAYANDVAKAMVGKAGNTAA